MERYVCADCGSLFDDPLVVHPSDPYDTTRHCPYCHSENFDEAVECECCGGIYTNDLTINGVCKDCVDQSITQMRRYMETGTQMDEKYRKAFLDFFDCL